MDALVERRERDAAAGRFVLLSCADGVEPQYVTSWDTWEEAEAAFPIGWMCFLRDDATGREWLPGAPYEWDVQPSSERDDDVIAFLTHTARMPLKVR